MRFHGWIQRGGGGGGDGRIDPPPPPPRIIKIDFLKTSGIDPLEKQLAVGLLGSECLLGRSIWLSVKCIDE